VENVVILLGNGVEILKKFTLNFCGDCTDLSTADDYASIVMVYS